VEIKDEELSELLERLAATDAMFKTPVSTIRDVSELTEASPKLVARILGEIRGPSDLEKLTERLDTYERRLKAVETRPPVNYSATPTKPPIKKTYPQPAIPVPKPLDVEKEKNWKKYRNWLEKEQAAEAYELQQNSTSPVKLWLAVVATLIFFACVIAINSQSGGSTRYPPPPFYNR